jgi:hypothetical protein
MTPQIPINTLSIPKPLKTNLRIIQQDKSNPANPQPLGTLDEDSSPPLVDPEQGSGPQIVDISHIDTSMISIDPELSYERHVYDSMRFMDKIKSLRFNDGSDRRHYGAGLPIIYIGNHPWVVIGKDWPFMMAVWIMMICYYFGGFANMYIIPRYYELSYAFLFVMRIAHFVSCFTTTLLNPGHASKKSFEHFNSDFKIGARNYKELEAVAKVKGWNKCVPCKIWCAKGTHHCSRCDACYYEVDHHCPWMGKCVAKDSLIAFYVYLILTFGMLFYGMT